MADNREAAFKTIVDEELHTIVKVLEGAGPGKMIYMYMVAIDPPVKNDEGKIEYQGVVHRWHSDTMLQSHARLVKSAMEREIEKLEKAINS